MPSSNARTSSAAQRQLSEPDRELIARLMDRFNRPDADFIITKLEINGWPTNWQDAVDCVRFDDFCYHNAMGRCLQGTKTKNKNNNKSKNDDIAECPRRHLKKYRVESLYKAGRASIADKRRAFYLAHYLYTYRGFENSWELRKFETAIQKDKDYKSLFIVYRNKWFNKINKIIKQKENQNRANRSQNDSQRQDSSRGYGSYVTTYGAARQYSNNYNNFNNFNNFNNNYNNFPRGGSDMNPMNSMNGRDNGRNGRNNGRNSANPMNAPNGMNAMSAMNGVNRGNGINGMNGNNNRRRNGYGNEADRDDFKNSGSTSRSYERSDGPDERFNNNNNNNNANYYQDNSYNRLTYSNNYNNAAPNGNTNNYGKNSGYNNGYDNDFDRNDNFNNFDDFGGNVANGGFDYDKIDKNDKNDKNDSNWDEVNKVNKVSKVSNFDDNGSDDDDWEEEDYKKGDVQAKESTQESQDWQDWQEPQAQYTDEPEYSMDTNIYATQTLPEYDVWDRMMSAEGTADFSKLNFDIGPTASPSIPEETHTMGAIFEDIDW